MGENEFNKIFARNLKYYLELHNMSQKELADKLGVVESTVSVWCQGKKTPRMDKVDMICDIFSIARSDLITDRNSIEAEIIEKLRLLNGFGRKYVLKQINYAMMDEDYIISAEATSAYKRAKRLKKYNELLSNADKNKKD